ncbi:MAG: DUF5009 domain-containing protein [Candidatus Marinimicrobia bacterium]|nr:DUF5009 domain-containing protein [Candidatus Neomarinimicrobiota bacterium]
MKRVESIDLFRGITIALMIFVNDVASVPAAPSWLHHVDASTDGMTLPDLVFPAFLFIVGMVIPLALDKRLKQGLKPSLKHIGERSLALIIMGVMMLNAGAYNPELSLLPKTVWQLLMYLSFFLIWNVWDPSLKRNRVIPKIGWILLLFLVATYRQGSAENSGWIQTGWWGILGLIGWAYGIASLSYLVSKKRKDILILSMGFCILLYIAEESGRFSAIQPFVDILHPGKFIGTHTLLVLTGVFAGLQIHLEPKQCIKALIQEAFFLGCAGWLLHKEYIVSKIQATPVWGLWSAALCSLAFALIFYITDVKKIKKCGKIFQPTAQNPLTAYLLPAIFYILFDLFSIPYFVWGQAGGGYGILRSLLFSGFILWVTHLLTRCKIQLKL